MEHGIPGARDEYLRREPDSYLALRAFAAIVHGRAEALDGLPWQGYQLGQPGMGPGARSTESRLVALGTRLHYLM